MVILAAHAQNQRQSTSGVEIIQAKFGFVSIDFSTCLLELFFADERPNIDWKSPFLKGMGGPKF